MGLNDGQLPSFFAASDTTSLAAQRATLRSNRIRLLGTIAAAAGGAFSFIVGYLDIWAFVALIGFVGAFIAELYIAFERPERGWYQARAAAESIKTLSWRYTMGADPFYLNLPDKMVDDLFRARVSQVAAQVVQVVSLPSGDGSSPTAPMRTLRHSPIAARRNAYLVDRTWSQRDWYTRKAAANRKSATTWRIILLTAEVIAIVLAAGRFFSNWSIDVTGILATVITGGAAWLALKQHTTLRSAYALTAAELEKQIATLHAVADEDWAKSVADAEEAISREHTMWLASRGDVNEKIG